MQIFMFVGFAVIEILLFKLEKKIKNYYGNSVKVEIKQIYKIFFPDIISF